MTYRESQINWGHVPAEKSAKCARCEEAERYCRCERIDRAARAVIDAERNLLVSCHNAQTYGITCKNGWEAAANRYAGLIPPSWHNTVKSYEGGEIEVREEAGGWPISKFFRRRRSDGHPGHEARPLKVFCTVY